MGVVYLLLGSNQGNRTEALRNAADLIVDHIGKINRRSAVYETQAWGFEADTAFLNQVLEVDTQKYPEEVLDGIHAIEELLGRIRDRERYTSRTIDIDILLYEDRMVNTPHLQIPHPRMHLRRFTLVPLAEIAGNLVHPVLKETIDTLNRDCRDELTVKQYNENS